MTSHRKPAPFDTVSDNGERRCGRSTAVAFGRPGSSANGTARQVSFVLHQASDSFHAVRFSCPPYDRLGIAGSDRLMGTLVALVCHARGDAAPSLFDLVGATVSSVNRSRNFDHNRSPENSLWLCAMHATEIDKDLERHRLSLRQVGASS